VLNADDLAQALVSLSIPGKSAQQPSGLPDLALRGRLLRPGPVEGTVTTAAASRTMDVLKPAG
jgi:hypothetical protein